MLGTLVHPCREVIYSNSRVHGNGRSELYPDLIQLDMDTCDANGYVGSGIAFSQGVEEGSLGIATTYLMLYNMLICTLLMLQDASLR